MDATAAPPVPGMQYRVAPRSVVALFSRTDTLVFDYPSQEHQNYENSDQNRRDASL